MLQNKIFKDKSVENVDNLERLMLLRSKINKFVSMNSVFFIFLIAMIFVGIVHTYTLTHGDMNLFINERGGVHYTHSWDNLKKSRYDLDCPVMEMEVFHRNGKCYMYYGLFPSFFRGFIELFLKRGTNTWSRISMLTASIITVLSFTLAYYLVTFKVQIPWFTRTFYTLLYLFIVSFGSPLFLMHSTGYIYHEAIIWGLAWSSVFVLAFVYQICAGKMYPVLLLIMSLSCGFALHSKMTFGSIGVAQVFLILLLIIAIFLKNQRNKLLNRLVTESGWVNLNVSNWKLVIKLFTCMILPLLACSLFAMKVNYERWGNPFSFTSHEHYEGFLQNQDRINTIKKFGNFSFLRLPHGFAYYFIPYGIHFSKDFPFTKPVHNNLFNDKFIPLRKIFPPEAFDYVEPSLPITLHSCGLVFLAVAGAFAFMRCFGLIGALLFLPLFLQAVFMLGFYSMALRYTPEFMPILVILSIPSFLVLTSFEKKSFLHKVLIRLFIVLLVLFNIYFGVTTMLHLKLYLWSTSGDAKDKIILFFNDVNKRIHEKSFLKAKEPIKVINSDEVPSSPKNGQLWVKNNGEVFWFNGIEWIQVVSPSDRSIVVNTPIHFKMKITFSNPIVGVSDPLLSIGNDSCRDTVFVKYLPNNSAVFSLVHSAGSNLAESKSFPINIQKTYNIEINLGSEKSPIVYIKVDGVEIFKINLTRCPTKGTEILLGRSRNWPDPSGRAFSGSILEASSVLYSNE